MEDSIRFFNISNGVIDIVLCNYGCTLVAVHAPDKDGKKANVVAGFNTVAEYKTDTHYIGCTVGRFANRIAFGRFNIDRTTYQLACNNDVNHLHGGITGFDKKIWQAEQAADGVRFFYLSKDGEEGYPGNVNVTVHFSLGNGNKLKIRYTATTDKPTIINLTNHSYFNLSGFEQANIYNHSLRIGAGHYTVKNEHNVPSGEMAPVLNTAYDFTKAKSLGTDIQRLPEDMGYDMNFVLDKAGDVSQAIAELYEPVSGRLLKVFTTQPGLQVYTANWWNGENIGIQNKPYHKHGAVALETQGFPDAPNHPHFPETVLRPGETYKHETIYEFLTR